MDKELLKQATDFIKKWEGCRLETYKCSAGVLTIGYGHTVNVQENQKITQEEADTLLFYDIAHYFNKLCKYIDVNLYNNNELTALISFSFNCGFPKKMVERYKNNDKDAIKASIPLYNKACGVVVKGLENRRKAELELFCS